MFTGLVRHVGTVVAVEPAGEGATLRIDATGWDLRPEPGDSIAVDGCCLTLAEPPAEGRPWRFDVVRQTLALTSLGDLVAGDRVNLEPSCTAETLLGGHLVQGHVEATGEVLAVERGDGSWRMRLSLPERLADRVVDQGSIAVAGTSLTVAGTGPGWFEVALIPTTLEETTLGDLEPGDRANLETDVVARMVIAWLERHGPALLERMLAGAGGRAGAGDEAARSTATGD